MKKYLLLFILTATFSFCYFLTTSSGLKWLIQQVENFIPGHLSIQHIDGKLFSAFNLTGISYQHSKKQITIEAITIRWDSFELLIKNANMKITDGPIIQLNSLVNKSWHGSWQLLFPQNKLHFSGKITGQKLNPIIEINPVFIAAVGITLEKNILYTHIFNRKLFFSGEFKTGKGVGKCQGNIGINTPLIVTIRGNHLQLVNLPEYKIIGSPDISLRLADSDLVLQGNLTIDHAEIVPYKIDQSDELPEEVVFIGQTTPKKSLRAITIKLNLHLNDDVFVNYKELQTHLRGDLRITKNPDSPASATGELTAVKGEFTAYGKTLIIENGRIIYTGNALNNPGLNIQAIRKIRTVVTNNSSQFTANTPLQPTYTGTDVLTVGIQIAGTAKNPKIKLFSNPSDLKPGDIISYLLFGKAQSQVSGSNILSALPVMNSSSNSKINNVITGVEQTLGVTDFSVEPMDVYDPLTQTVQSKTAVSVAKRIGNKLYLHYSIGLFSPIGVLSLRYQMNKHWAIKTETSSIDNGADVVYQVERN